MVVNRHGNSSHDRSAAGRQVVRASVGLDPFELLWRGCSVVSHVGRNYERDGVTAGGRGDARGQHRDRLRIAAQRSDVGLKSRCS